MCQRSAKYSADSLKDYKKKLASEKKEVSWGVFQTGRQVGLHQWFPIQGSGPRQGVARKNLRGLEAINSKGIMKKKIL